MAKYLVEKAFVDKETSQFVAAGSFFETDDKKRLKVAFDGGFLKEVEEKEPVKKANTRQKSGE